jgi:hypothetical protein
MMIVLRKLDEHGVTHCRSIHENLAGSLLYRDAAYGSPGDAYGGSDADSADNREAVRLDGRGLDLQLSAVLAVSAAEGYDMLFCSLSDEGFPLSAGVVTGLWGSISSCAVHHVRRERMQIHSARKGKWRSAEEQSEPFRDYFFAMAFSSEEK